MRCGYPTSNENHHDCCPDGEDHKFISCVGVRPTYVSSSLAAKLSAMPRRHDNDNPLWAGPCGEGALGGITQSMLVRFMSCRERFRLKYVCGLESPDKWNHRIGYGNMWHTCEEALATPAPDGETWGVTDWWMKNLTNHYVDMIQRYRMQEAEIHKWFMVCRTQFPEYVKYWAEHPDVKNRTPLLQEQAFDVPYVLPSGRVVRLRGKWDSVDLIAEETEGRLGRHQQSIKGIWLQENKTKGDINRLQVERQLKFDLQTMLYLVALTELEKVTDRGETDNPLPDDCCMYPIRGVRYNVVRRPLSGGKGNISPHKEKATKTKFTPAESDYAFYERLRHDYIAAEPDYWFFRVRADVSAHDIEVFRRTCLDPLLEQLCWWYEETTGDDRRYDYQPPPMNYRTPFGVYSALEEGGATEYDAYLSSGSESGLRRVTELFPELK